ncbi:hypothetical protein B0H19DRAFT_1226968 [Mycena capillaripes]|nr:hypothetical protein B0H19DRAFT_1226968 [Mycena capillaripes]
MCNSPHCFMNSIRNILPTSDGKKPLLNSSRKISGGRISKASAKPQPTRLLIPYLSANRYSAENFPNILKLADGLKAIGVKYNNATAGQVALAWLLAQGDDIIPIPGTKKIKYLEENLGALKVTLSAEDVKAVREVAAAADTAKRERYPASLMSQLFADTPAA